MTRRSLRLRTAAAAVLAAATLLAAPPALPAVGADLRGTWRNHDGSVLVRIDQCGAEICGTVVGATPSAEADARDGGYPHLIGLRILFGYHATGPRRWVGRVLVPDLGHVFSSHIDLVDQDHARVAGCLFRQHLCQTQTWQRT